MRSRVPTLLLCTLCVFVAGLAVIWAGWFSPRARRAANVTVEVVRPK